MMNGNHSFRQENIKNAQKNINKNEWKVVDEEETNRKGTMIVLVKVTTKI